MQSVSKNQKINKHLVGLGVSIVKRRPQTILSDSVILSILNTFLTIWDCMSIVHYSHVHSINERCVCIMCVYQLNSKWPFRQTWTSNTLILSSSLCNVYFTLYKFRLWFLDGVVGIWKMCRWNLSECCSGWAHRSLLLAQYTQWNCRWNLSSNVDKQ